MWFPFGGSVSPVAAAAQLSLLAPSAPPLSRCPDSGRGRGHSHKKTRMGRRPLVESSPSSLRARGGSPRARACSSSESGPRLRQVSPSPGLQIRRWPCRAVGCGLRVHASLPQQKRSLPRAAFFLLHVARFHGFQEGQVSERQRVAAPTTTRAMWDKTMIGESFARFILGERGQVLDEDERGWRICKVECRARARVRGCRWA